MQANVKYRTAGDSNNVGQVESSERIKTCIGVLSERLWEMVI